MADVAAASKARRRARDAHGKADDLRVRKCLNRECKNLGGYVNHPRSLYCSKRCQWREQNLRQGRVKNIRKQNKAVSAAGPACVDDGEEAQRSDAECSLDAPPEVAPLDSRGSGQHGAPPEQESPRRARMVTPQGPAVSFKRYLDCLQDQAIFALCQHAAGHYVIVRLPNEEQRVQSKDGRLPDMDMAVVDFPCTVSAPSARHCAAAAPPPPPRLPGGAYARLHEAARLAHAPGLPRPCLPPQDHFLPSAASLADHFHTRPPHPAVRRAVLESAWHPPPPSSASSCAVGSSAGAPSLTRLLEPFPEPAPRSSAASRYPMDTMSAQLEKTHALHLSQMENDNSFFFRSFPPPMRLANLQQDTGHPEPRVATGAVPQDMSRNHSPASNSANRTPLAASPFVASPAPHPYFSSSSDFSDCGK